MKETPTFKVERLTSVNLSSWRVAPQEIIINSYFLRKWSQEYAAVIQAVVGTKRWRICINLSLILEKKDKMSYTHKSPK